MKIKESGKGYLVLTALLLILLGALFSKSFHTESVVHNNDAPVGTLVSDSSKMPEILTGYWKDLNWLGGPLPSAGLGVSALFYYLSGGIVYAKFNAPFALLVLGICTYFFFRQLGFARAVALLGACASVLNSNVFSNACWGQTSRAYALAAAFLALGLLRSSVSKNWLVKIPLAGMAVGWGVAEAFDVGAIFSLYVATFCLALFILESRSVAGIGKGSITLVLVTVFALLFASRTLMTLVGTQIQGIAGVEQTSEARSAKWAEATQWSTPKIETLRLLIPGSHGYRMDTPDGGQYWGRVGQSEGWGTDINGDGTIDRVGMPRFSGSGEYAGILVILLAIYAIALALQKKNATFSDREKKFIWFWAVLAIISLVMAWGRFGPLYKLVYQLPYFSTIRNPMKFMHPFHMILLILFGYGLQALYRQYVEAAIARSSSFSEQWKKFWTTASRFDQKWVIGCVMIVGIAALSWLIFNASAKSFQKHLVDFAGLDAGLAVVTAKFSIREVGLFVLFLAVSVGAVLAVMSGWFSGPRAKWAGLLLGTILLVDLARANQPWIIYYDYKYKYATNPVLEKLREEPYKNRVTMFAMAFPQNDNFSALYAIEWLQQHFPFYNIQSLDVVQMPREPLDYSAFAGMASGAFPYRNGVIDPKNISILPRYWKLTNTRYILGPAGLADALNAQFKTQAFQVPMRFDLAAKGDQAQVRRLEDLTVAPKADGKYALIEFTNALPRAKLYSNWQVSTNQTNTLERLKSPDFNPDNEVIVSTDTRFPDPQAPDRDPGTVEFSSYAPKKIVLSANASAPSVLLLNDKYDPNWQVTVDGKPAQLLQANFIMRGVYLEPGKHEVVFSFTPPNTALYVSLAAGMVGLILCGFLIVSTKRNESAEGVRSELPGDNKKKA